MRQAFACVLCVVACGRQEAPPPDAAPAPAPSSADPPAAITPEPPASHAPPRASEAGTFSEPNVGPGKVEGLKGIVNVGAVTSDVPIADADRVVAGLRPRFRACYQRGLDVDPMMAGKLTIEVRLVPEGEVEAASPTTNTGIAPAVASCAALAVQRVTFSAPGKRATLRFALTFAMQKP
jgi:hypothetical protein